ncbi:hypothetical protein V8E51_009173 [Hyaloscypha variabilis]
MSANQGDFAGKQVHIEMGMPSQQCQAHWHQLSIQLSPINLIIAIDLRTFMSWNHVDQDFIVRCYMRATGGTIPQFVPDVTAPRMFLGPLAMFQRHPGFQLPTLAQFPQAVGPQYIGAQLQGQAVAGGVQGHAVAGGAQLHAVAGGAQPQAVVAGAANSAPRSGRVKANAGQPPRPRNAWILFRQHYHNATQAAHPELTNNQISSFIATMWHNEPQAVKDFWHRKAAEEKAEHQRKYPNYVYKPRKSTDKKRRSTTKKTTVPTLHLTPANPEALVAHGYPPTATVTITGNSADIYDPTVIEANNSIITNDGVVGDLDLAAEAKIFYERMMAGAAEMINATETGAYAQLFEFEGADNDGQQPEGGATHDSDDEDFFKQFFNFN